MLHYRQPQLSCTSIEEPHPLGCFETRLPPISWATSRSCSGEKGDNPACARSFGSGLHVLPVLSPQPHCTVYTALVLRHPRCMGLPEDPFTQDTPRWLNALLDFFFARFWSLWKNSSLVHFFFARFLESVEEQLPGTSSLTAHVEVCAAGRNRQWSQIHYLALWMEGGGPILLKSKLLKRRQKKKSETSSHARWPFPQDREQVLEDEGERQDPGQGAHEEMWERQRLCFGNSHPSTSVCLYFTRQNIYHRTQALPW